MPVMSRADIRPNRRGVPVLTRHWHADSAWASMLIVHGLGEHSGRYERTGSSLADAGIEVWAFDLVGFGGSGGDRGDIESWRLYLDDVADQLVPVFESGRPNVLLGHSFGGLVAASYATSLNRQPDYLVLSSPALGFGGPGWKRSLAPALSRLAPRLALPNDFDGAILSRDPAVGAAYVEDPLVVMKTTTRLGAAAFAEMDRVNANLSAITMPTYVFHGGADELIPPSASVGVGNLANAERRIYPHLRHETLNEPEGPEVVADVVAWIRRKLDHTG